MKCALCLRIQATIIFFTDVNQVEGLETTYLDITDIDAIRKMVKDNNVNAIVNCAAWTNVDACETDEKLAALAEN